MSVSVAINIHDHGALELLRKANERTRAGWRSSAMKALAAIERHHKLQEMIRAARGGKLTSGDKVEPHPTKLTIRTGTLSRSYTRRIIDAELFAGYGSDLVYAPVHEFGSPTNKIPARPGVQNTLNALDSQIEAMFADGVSAAMERGQ